MKAFVLACAAAAAFATAGCSATPKLGEHVTLEGTLVLKGNAPRTMPVLVRGGTDQWELVGVQPAGAAALQNRKVQASGVVTRLPADGAQMPALRVDELKPAP